MRWNFLILIIVLFSVMAVSTLAESDIVVTTLKNQVSVGDYASFEVKITNNADENQRYSIYSFQSGQGWNVDPYPLRDKVIEIPRGKSYTATIRVRATEDFIPGIYYVSITIESDLGERHTESLKIYLAPEKPLDYLPSIKADLEMQEKIDPTKPTSIKLFLENKNPLNLKDLKIKIQSDINEFVEEVAVDLPPLGKKTVEFSITPSPYQQPKDYVLFFVFERNGEVVKIIEKNIEIVSLLPPFDYEVVEETIFLKEFSQLKIRNEGNVLNSQKVKYPVSFWQNLFTQSEAVSIREEGQRYLMWELTLHPNEMQAVSFITNYRLLIYILTISLIFLSFYYYVKSPVLVNKSVITTKSDSEGALSEIKVSLELINKSGKLLKDATVEDLVPAIANVEKSLELGTLKPKEIKHTKNGTKVIWQLAEIDSREHRLITYKVRAKLNILGKFSLPRATVIYHYKRGKKGKAYSNLISLGSK